MPMSEQASTCIPTHFQGEEEKKKNLFGSGQRRDGNEPFQTGLWPGPTRHPPVQSPVSAGADTGGVWFSASSINSPRLREDSEWQLLGSSSAAPHHTTGTPCKLTFLSSCLPCPQVFKHHNHLNEIMRETHSNAVEGTVLLLRQQRELIESTGKKAFEGKRRVKE